MFAACAGPHRSALEHLYVNVIAKWETWWMCWQAKYHDTCTITQTNHKQCMFPLRKKQAIHHHCSLLHIFCFCLNLWFYLGLLAIWMTTWPQHFPKLVQNGLMKTFSMLAHTVWTHRMLMRRSCTQGMISLQGHKGEGETGANLVNSIKISPGWVPLRGRKYI